MHKNIHCKHCKEIKRVYSEITYMYIINNFNSQINSVFYYYNDTLIFKHCILFVPGILLPQKVPEPSTLHQ